MRLFSQRHKGAIEKKKLPLSVPKKARQKLIYSMQKYNKYYGWNNEDSIFYDDLKTSLIQSYGESSLKAYVKDVFQETHNIEIFMQGTRPEYVCDAIEMYSTLIDEDRKEEFHTECNEIFRSEDSPLRILDGCVVKLASDFLESEVLDKAYELLKDNRFEKACKDFLLARNNLTAGDYSGTISEANNAIESTLKKVLNRERGEQKDLKKWLMKSGIIPEYFQGFCDHFEGLLQSAFTIANQSSRHGKKEVPDKKNDVDFAVASFVLHLTGSLIVFIMERYQESLVEDDVPF
jgi:hypothetical protein